MSTVSLTNTVTVTSVFDPDECLCFVVVSQCRDDGSDNTRQPPYTSELPHLSVITLFRVTTHYRFNTRLDQNIRQGHNNRRLTRHLTVTKLIRVITFVRIKAFVRVSTLVSLTTFVRKTSLFRDRVRWLLIIVFFYFHVAYHFGVLTLKIQLLPHLSQSLELPR